MENQNINNNKTFINVNDGDISFVWEGALSNSGNFNNIGSNCPTPTSEQAQNAVAVAVEVGEGSGTAAQKKKRARKGKQPAASGSGGGGEAAAGGGVDPDHELHIFTERERRKKMRCRFTELLAMLPHAPAKADKSSIVDEAVNYITILQQKYQNLQRQKLQMYQGQAPTYDPLRSAESSSSREAFIADQGSSAHQDNYQILTSGNPLSGGARYATTLKTWTTPNLVLSICGDRAQINICCPKRAGIFAVICYYLEKYKLQVLYATVSCDLYRCMFMIQAHASGGVEAGLTVEDLFQLAMGEIMMHISTMQ